MIVEKSRENYWCLSWLDEYMEGHKGFICGGCFKNIFNGEKVKDIDIFFKSLEDWNDAKTYYDELSDNENSNIRFYYETPSVKAYKNKSTGIVIELCRTIFGTAEEIIKQFDFTITKFSYFKKDIETKVFDDPFDETGAYKTETSLEYWVMFDDNFFEHLHMHRLVIDDNIPFPASSFERMLRYAKYGYFPCRDTKMKLLKAINELPENALNVSKSLYEGMD